jgi:hypothetical protein
VVTDSIKSVRTRPGCVLFTLLFESAGTPSNTPYKKAASLLDAPFFFHTTLHHILDESESSLHLIVFLHHCTSALHHILDASDSWSYLIAFQHH